MATRAWMQDFIEQGDKGFDIVVLRPGIVPPAEIIPPELLEELNGLWGVEEGGDCVGREDQAPIVIIAAPLSGVVLTQTENAVAYRQALQRFDPSGADSFEHILNCSAAFAPAVDLRLGVPLAQQQDITNFVAAVILA